MGRVDGPISPVKALLIVIYLSVRGMAHGPLFRFADGSPLTRTGLVAAVRHACAESSWFPGAGL